MVIYDDARVKIKASSPTDIFKQAFRIQVHNLGGAFNTDSATWYDSYLYMPCCLHDIRGVAVAYSIMTLHCDVTAANSHHNYNAYSSPGNIT